MYRVVIDIEAQPAVDVLPAAAAAAFMELRTALETSPHTLGEAPGSGPTGMPTAMRSREFGPGGLGLVMWFVQEDQRQVHVVAVVWVGQP